MSDPILTFNAKSVSCDKLEKTLIGRKEVVDQIFNELHEKLLQKSTYQSLLVAPRGSGKTHLTKVLYCRLKKAPDLQDKIIIAYMIEDEYGISNFVHLCLQILNAFARYKVTGAEIIPDAIAEISELPSKNQEAAIKKFLLDFIGEKSLVILLENLDNILDGMGKEAAKLRDFMHEYNKVSLVTTAQGLSDQLTDSKYPFYHFFKTRHLNKLDFEASFKLIKALASLEEQPQRDELLKALNNDKDMPAKIRAIYELTSGNHRLIVHFYGFLKADIKSELSKVFVKQMNDLKSYYEQFAKQLPVQQQRLVQMLSLSRQPMKGRDITKKAFLSANVVSKQLSELHKKGFIDKTQSGKEVYYELQEPLMRICFEINENPDGIAKLFVDFLKVIYEPMQLKKNYLLFKYGANHQQADFRQKYTQEALMYSKALDKKAVYLSPEIEAELSQCSEEELVYKVEALIEEESMDYAQAWDTLVDARQFEEALELCLKWIKVKPDSGDAYSNLGYIYNRLTQYKKAINSFENAIELGSNDHDTYYNLGCTFFNIQKYIKAIYAFEKAINLQPNDLDSYNSLGVALYGIQEYKKAINAFEKSITLNKKYSIAHYNLGATFFKIQEYEKAINAYKKAISFDKKNPLPLFGIIRITILQKDTKAIKSQLLNALSLEPLNEQYFSIHDSILRPLLKVSPLDFTKKILPDLFKIFKQKERLDDLYDAFPSSIFGLLIEIETYTDERLHALQKILSKTFGQTDKMKIPLLMLDVGIRYLKNGEKRALFDLSKEERKVFKDFVLVPREEKLKG